VRSFYKIAYGIFKRNRQKVFFKRNRVTKRGRGGDDFDFCEPTKERAEGKKDRQKKLHGFHKGKKCKRTMPEPGGKKRYEENQREIRREEAKENLWIVA